MQRRDFIKLSSLSAAAVGAKGYPLAVMATGRKPNIVLFLADDMGYSDLGCQGSEIDTPNLDRLAHNGIQFSSFYNSPRC